MQGPPRQNRALVPPSSHPSDTAMAQHRPSSLCASTPGWDATSSRRNRPKARYARSTTALCSIGYTRFHTSLCLFLFSLLLCTSPPFSPGSPHAFAAAAEIRLAGPRHSAASTLVAPGDGGDGAHASTGQSHGASVRWQSGRAAPWAASGADGVIYAGAALLDSDEGLAHGCHACACLPSCRSGQCNIVRPCSTKRCTGHCKWPRDSSRGRPIGACRLGNCSHLNPGLASLLSEGEAARDEALVEDDEERLVPP